ASAPQGSPCSIYKAVENQTCSAASQADELVYRPHKRRVAISAPLTRLSSFLKATRGSTIWSPANAAKAESVDVNKLRGGLKVAAVMPSCAGPVTEKSYREG